MSFKTIIKFTSAHLFVFTLAFFIRFYAEEHGDLNVVILGTFIYLPYILGLTLFNSALLTFVLHSFKKNFLKWLSASFTSVILLVGMLIAGGKIEVHYWKINHSEFLAISMLLILINLVTLYATMYNKPRN